MYICVDGMNKQTCKAVDGVGRIAIPVWGSPSSIRLQKQIQLQEKWVPAMPWLSIVGRGLQWTWRLSLRFKEHGGEDSCCIWEVCPSGCGCSQRLPYWRAQPFTVFQKQAFLLNSLFASSINSIHAPAFKKKKKETQQTADRKRLEVVKAHSYVEYGLGIFPSKKHFYHQANLSSLINCQILSSLLGLSVLITLPPPSNFKEPCKVDHQILLAVPWGLVCCRHEVIQCILHIQHFKRPQNYGSLLIHILSAPRGTDFLLSTSESSKLHWRLAEATSVTPVEITPWGQKQMTPKADTSPWEAQWVAQ